MGVYVVLILKNKEIVVNSTEVVANNDLAAAAGVAAANAEKLKDVKTEELQVVCTHVSSLDGDDC
jgi:DNA-binding Xre family transcriptional regulator